MDCTEERRVLAAMEKVAHSVYLDATSQQTEDAAYRHKDAVALGRPADDKLTC